MCLNNPQTASPPLWKNHLLWNPSWCQKCWGLLLQMLHPSARGANLLALWMSENVFILAFLGLRYLGIEIYAKSFLSSWFCLLAFNLLLRSLVPLILDPLYEVYFSFSLNSYTLILSLSPLFWNFTLVRVYFCPLCWALAGTCHSTNWPSSIWGIFLFPYYSFDFLFCFF